MRTSWLAVVLVGAAMAFGLRCDGQVGKPVVPQTLFLPAVAPTVIRLPVIAPAIQRAVEQTPAAKPVPVPATAAPLIGMAPVATSLATGPASATAQQAAVVPPMPAILTLPVVNLPVFQLPSAAPVVLHPLVITFDLGPAVPPVPVDAKNQAPEPAAPAEYQTGLGTILQTVVPGLDWPILPLLDVNGTPAL